MDSMRLVGVARVYNTGRTCSTGHMNISLLLVAARNMHITMVNRCRLLVTRVFKAGHTKPSNLYLPLAFSRSGLNRSSMSRSCMSRNSRSMSRISRPVVTGMSRSRSVGPGCMVSTARVHHAGCTSTARDMDLAVLRVTAGNVDLGMSRGVVGRDVMGRPVVIGGPSIVLLLVTAVDRGTV